MGGGGGGGVFFFKQKTAYEIVSRDWSSDVCSSDLRAVPSKAAMPPGEVGLDQVKIALQMSETSAFPYSFPNQTSVGCPTNF